MAIRTVDTYVKGVGLSELVGKSLKIAVDDGQEVVLSCTDGSIYSLKNIDVSGSVTEAVSGKFKREINSRIIFAEESSCCMIPVEGGPSYTLTFYNIITENGRVHVRFTGNANGGYSIPTNLIKLKEDIVKLEEAKLETIKLEEEARLLEEKRLADAAVKEVAPIVAEEVVKI